MNRQKEFELIKICLVEIEEKLAWGSSELWHNEVFDELSQIIHQNTNVLLSPITLKRVWGKVNYSSLPSISTLNALSQFVDYTNWRDFKNKNSLVLSKKKAIVFSKKKLIFFSSLAFFIIFFIWFYSFLSIRENTTQSLELSKISFSSRPVTQGLPNSVVFDLELNELESDSIFIQLFWDPTKTIKINSNQQQATGIYYYPGYFRAKLLVNGHSIKENDLFITTNEWLGTIDYDPIPKYITSEISIDKNLSFPSSILNEIKSSESPIYSTFHYVMDLGKVSGDNLSIHTTIKNVYDDKWAVCQSTRIIILGTKGALIIPFSILGCVSNIRLVLNDQFINGKTKDMSAFGIDLGTFKNIDICVRDKKVKIFVDQHEIFSGKYNESIGQFVGIRYSFLGAGTVGNLSIRDNKDTEIVDGNFGLQ